jgi:hypothetical protein
MAEFASKGVAGAGLGLGIAGTALGVANGGFNNLLGGLTGNNNCNNCNKCGYGNSGNVLSAIAMNNFSNMFSSIMHDCTPRCNETIGATRYDLGVMNQLAEKDAIIARLQGSQETDKKILELYQYVNSRDKATGEAIAQIAAAQAVTNQKLVDDMRFVEADLNNKISAERKERCCADNSIVTYANATFYAKLVAGVTPTTATTPQEIYNPLPNCGGCCGGCNN